MLPSHLQCPGQLLAWADERGLPWLVHQQEQRAGAGHPWALSSHDKLAALDALDDAVEALDALAAMVPPGADGIPPERITSAVGQELLRTEPRRFGRLRLSTRRTVFVELRGAALASVPSRVEARDKNLDALFAEVLARPDDDAPRLVFADAIGATDPDAAEFIVAQVRQRRAARDGRAVPAALAGVIAAHLTKYGRVWSNGVAALVDRYEFRGGFVESVALPADRFPAQADALFAVAPLRHVSLTGVEVGLAAALAHPRLQGVVALTLSGSGGLSALSVCRPLRQVEVLDVRGVAGAAPALSWPALREYRTSGG